MKKKIIYSGFSDERRLIIDFLCEQKDWNPVFILGPERMREWVKNNYSHSVFQEATQLRKAQFNYSVIGKAVPVDAEIIISLSEYELSCLNLLEDATGWNFSFAERRRYYYDILKYWNTVIHRQKPDLYVIFTWPHVITDYVLYLLCKHYYSIPTIFVDPVPHFNYGYHVIGSSVEDLSVPVKNIYDSGQGLDLHTDIEKYLNNLRSKKGKTPEYISRYYKRIKKYDKFQYKELLRLILSTLLHGTGFRKACISYKKNREPFDSSNSQMNGFDYFWFKEKLRRKNIQLRKIYKSFSTKPDMNKKYVYFAAPYQPEAVNCPNAGVYCDLLLVLDILSASIPDDWMIYYKEHPGTFLGGNKGSLMRDRHFYEKIVSYHNLKIVPAETDSFKLIDSSQAVVSIAGTASWEAAVRGKPSLFFGNVWYQGCKSIFKINTYQDCVSAIGKIKNGYTPDQEDIERYAVAVQQVAIKGMIHNAFNENIKKCSDPKYEMERIAKLIADAYNKYYV